MEHLLYLQRAYVRELKGHVASNPDQLLYYRKGEFPFNSARILRSPLRPGGAPPKLLIPPGGSSRLKKAATDAANAEKLYRWLPNMTEAQAADERLWVYLTHVTFLNYTRIRWPATKPTEVVDHWFLRSPGLSGLRRNSIARLWWAAHLTAEPWGREPDLAFLKSGDSMRFTEVLLRSQDLFQHLMERAYGGNLRLRICLLAAIDPYLVKGQNMAKLSSEVCKRINLIGAYRGLDTLPAKALKDEMDKLVTMTAASV